MGSVTRFTPYQDLLSEELKKLITLYYVLVGNKGRRTKESDTLLKDIVTSLAGNFNYDDTQGFFYRRQYKIRADEEDLHRFMGIMSELQKATLNGETSHFILEGVKNDLTTSLTFLDPLEGVKDDLTTSLSPLDPGSVKGKSKGKAPRTGQQDTSPWSVPTSYLDRVAQIALKKEERVTEVRNHVEVTAVNYRLFHVRALTDFGALLLRQEPQEDPSYAIPSVNFQSWISFVQMVRAILVNFHFSFGGFNRIKSCRQCGKLTFEKKGRSKFYCSKECTKKHSDASQPSTMRLCRERQNTWIRSQYAMNKDWGSADIEPETIKKNECVKCERHVDKPGGGDCALLCRKNLQAFQNMGKTVNRRAKKK